MVKVTFTLDDVTVSRLKRTAERLKKPQSWVVREAVAEFAAKEDRLTPDEKTRMLAALEQFQQVPVSGDEAGDARALAETRAARRLSSLRRTPQ